MLKLWCVGPRLKIFCRGIAEPLWARKWMEGSPALEHLEQQASWAAFHIARLEEVITSQQRAIETLESRLRRLENEAIEAVSDLYFGWTASVPLLIN